MTLSETVNANIERALKDNERPRAWLARQLGVKYETLASRLKGEKAWTLDELPKVASLLGTTPSELQKKRRA